MDVNRVAELMAEIVEISDHRFQINIVPEGWTDDQAERLQSLNNRILRGGVVKLIAVEMYLNNLEEE